MMLYDAHMILYACVLVSYRPVKYTEFPGKLPGFKPSTGLPGITGNLPELKRCDSLKSKLSFPTCPIALRPISRELEPFKGQGTVSVYHEYHISFCFTLALVPIPTSVSIQSPLLVLICIYSYGNMIT